MNSAVPAGTGFKSISFSRQLPAGLLSVAPDGAEWLSQT